MLPSKVKACKNQPMAAGLLQMCCEQDDCALAVFNEEEAICYLKGSGALESYNDVDAEGVSSYTIERRIGEYHLIRPCYKAPMGVTNHP